VIGISDVITYVNLGEDRLRGLGVTGVKVCPSPLTLIVTLKHCRTTMRVCDTKHIERVYKHELANISRSHYVAIAT